jgi:two-component system response regulator DevR
LLFRFIATSDGSLICPLNSTTPIRVLIVDDSSLLRHGIAAVLEHAGQETPIIVVGEAGSRAEALPACKLNKPDVVLLDIRLPDGSGTQVCREILEHNPRIRIIVLTSHMEDEYLYEALTAGAQGYLLKEVQPSALVQAIQKVARGESILSTEMTQRVLGMIKATSQIRNEDVFTSLSPQEKRVLHFVIKGKTNKEIAEAMGLSGNTVKNYLGTVFEKLHVKRRAEAAALYAKFNKRGLGPFRPTD